LSGNIPAAIDAAMAEAVILTTVFPNRITDSSFSGLERR
jgi:hypothetical protein